MRRNSKRLSQKEYFELKDFKKEVREERIGKIFKDHAGHIYKVDENGSIRRQSIETAIAESTGNSSPGIKKLFNS